MVYHRSLQHLKIMGKKMVNIIKVPACMTTTTEEIVKEISKYRSK